jgi:hypothetical protein
LRFCESLLWQGPGSWVVCDWMQFLDLEESLRMANQLCFCTDMLSRNYELFWAFYFWCWIVFSCVKHFSANFTILIWWHIDFIGLHRGSSLDCVNPLSQYIWTPHMIFILWPLLLD